MMHGPSGRPPPDGYPETRGSRIGAEQERERARKRLELGKSRNQKRAERNNRKRRNGRRKHQQRLDEASRSKPVMEQQSLPVEKKHEPRRLHEPTPSLRAEIRACIDANEVDGCARWWVANGGWHRTSCRDRFTAARALIGAHYHSGKTSCAAVIRDLMRMVESLPPAGKEASQPADAPLERHDDVPLSRYEKLLDLQQQTNQLLTEVLMRGLKPTEGPQGPSSFTMPSRPQFARDEETAPVVEMSEELEERINKFVQDEVIRRGGRGILNREDEKSELFRVVWGELDEAVYRECGVDPGAKSRRVRGKSRIDVCREMGIIGELHKLAFRMFGPRDPAGAKSGVR